MDYRWNIYLVNLDPVMGSEQGKTSPVLIISDDDINQTRSQRFYYPTHSHHFQNTCTSHINIK